MLAPHELASYVWHWDPEGYTYNTWWTHIPGADVANLVKITFNDPDPRCRLRLRLANGQLITVRRKPQ